MGALCTVHATSKVEPAPQSAAASQFQVRLVVEKAHSLPKTDVLSKIDAYIRVKAGSQEFKTKVIDDHDSPTWNEVFFPVISANGSILAGCIEFELWDANVVKGEASACLSLWHQWEWHIPLHSPGAGCIDDCAIDSQRR